MKFPTDGGNTSMITLSEQLLKIPEKGDVLYCNKLRTLKKYVKLQKYLIPV